MGKAFIIVNMEEFIGSEQIPGFDSSIKWTFQQDRPPRRRVSSSPNISPSGSPAKEISIARWKNQKQTPARKIISPSSSPSQCSQQSTVSPSSIQSKQSQQPSTNWQMEMEEQNNPLVRQRSLDSEHDSMN